jgi:hypothetical protein
MENYIVRKYRHDCSDLEKVTGMPESVEKESRQSCHSTGAPQSPLKAVATAGLLKPQTSGVRTCPGRYQPPLSGQSEKFQRWRIRDENKLHTQI